MGKQWTNGVLFGPFPDLPRDLAQGASRSSSGVPRVLIVGAPRELICGRTGAHFLKIGAHVFTARGALAHHSLQILIGGSISLTLSLFLLPSRTPSYLLVHAALCSSSLAPHIFPVRFTTFQSSRCMLLRF